MIAIDESLFEEVNLATLPSETKQDLAATFRETLEVRVGTVIAEGLTEQELDEFGVFAAADDEDGARQWLNENAPNYQDVVLAEFNTLKAELKEAAPKILAFSTRRPDAC